MNYRWYCECGEVTSCSSKVFKLGSIWNCKSCNNTYALVKNINGTGVWVGVKSEYIEFRELLDDNGNSINQS